MANVTWEPEWFSNLNKLLTDLDSEHTTGSASLEQIKKQLEQAKPDLARLLYFPGKSTARRDALTKGKPTINGVEFEVNEQFIKEAKKLSDFLELDEDLAATLLQNAPAFEKQYELPAGETAVVLFYGERSAKLECISRLLTASGAQDTLDSDVCAYFNNYVSELLSSTLSTGSSMLPARIMSTMSALKSQQERVAGILNGPLADVPYDESVMEHVQLKLADERNQLATIIYWIIRHNQLNGSELLALVEWLRGSNVEDAATLRMAVALLMALGTAADQSLGVEMASTPAMNKIGNLAQDSQLLVKLNAEIIDKTWTDDGLKGLVWLQWALLALFGMKQWPGFDQLIGFREDRVERIAEQAIQMGAYRFATEYLLGYRITDDLESEFSAEFLVLQRQTTKPAAGESENNQKRYPHFTDIPEDFQKEIEQLLEDTVSDFIERMSSLIRRLRYSEEDAIHAAQQSELQRIAQEEQRQLQAKQAQLLQQSGGYRNSRLIGAVGQAAAAAAPAVPAASAAAVEAPRRDTEALFLLITVLYAGRPNAGLRFWGRTPSFSLQLDDRLAVFLRWGSECREQGMIRGYFNMLSSLACGSQGSICAYEFMGAAAGGGGQMMTPSTRTHVASNQAPLCSWSALFGALQFYAGQLRPSSDPLVAAPEIPEAEVGLLRSFLRLCQTTVRYSLVARTSLYDVSKHDAVATMFGLLGCVVPVSLKASLLDAIAAFGELDLEALGISENDSEAGARVAVDDMARRIWGLLEQSQTLPTTTDIDALRQQQARHGDGGGAVVASTPGGRMAIGRGFSGPAAGGGGRGGIVYELEEVEAATETYAQMRGFVRLISTLIHVSGTVPGLADVERDPVLYSAQSPSVPADLGAAYRIPGISPYVVFVLDSVLLKAGQRSYRYASEKWRVFARALEVVEKSVGTLDLGAFATNAPGAATGPGALRMLATHPGFDVAIRVLCGSKLLDALLEILNVGTDAVIAATGSLGASIERAVLLTLRTLLRVMRLQETLLRVVVPLVMEAASAGELGFPVNLPRSLTTLEQLLLTRRRAVEQLATYVTCGGAVCLAAVKVLHRLSDSAAFNGVDDSGGGGGGGGAWKRRGGAGMLTLNRLVSIIDGSVESVRILHGFIKCLRQDDGAAEDCGADEGVAARGLASGLDDHRPRAPSVRIAIVDLLLGNLTAAKPAPTIAHYLLGFSLAKPASEDLPSPAQRATCLHAVLDVLREGECGALLSERCLRLVHQLCADPVTGDVTLRYLREREDFVATQLRASFAAPAQRPAVDVFALMHARAWLWRTAALELHALVMQDARTRARALAGWLAGDVEDDGSGSGGGGVLDARMRVLALLDGVRAAERAGRDAGTAMDEDDGDDDAAGVDADADSCLVANGRGCLVYDLHALVALLRQAGGRAEAVRRVAVRCFHANQQRELHGAYVAALRGWRELAQVLATSAWASAELPRDARERTGFQLLRGVAGALADDDAQADELEALAPALPVFAGRLAREKDALLGKTEALLGMEEARLFQLLVAAALTPAASASLQLRGNVYAAMLHFLGGRRCADAVGDRLLETVSADAADATDTWRTVAFSLLDALVAADAQSSVHASRVVVFLARKNYFAAYVAALLRREDHAVQAVLAPDAPSLNALYIYRAKMAFFLRLAQRGDGAERLLENGIVDVLADCGFLDLRPQT
ncbi:hypothetical protein IWW38_002498, partial [Coemansia aciculifera]